MRANFMEIAFLSKLEKTNINASGTEGNVTILKKTEEIDGTQRIYISGASLKYAIKTYLAENGWILSEIKPKTRTAQITTECNPKERIDDDLFGYLDTEADKKRVAPIKTNGMISLFPYKGDLNRGVRFDPEGKEHSLYDIEIATNVFRSNWAVELDRIGKGDDWEVPAEEKEKRIKAFLKALFNLWSRVKQTNFLTKISPEVIVFAFRDDKTLTIADKLRIDENYNLDVEALKEALDYHKDSLKEVYIGGMKSFVKNWDDVVEELNGYLDGKIRVKDLPSLKDLVISNDFKFYE